MNDSIGDIIKWIGNHKYLSVTLAFLAIIIIFDENSLLKHIQHQREILGLKSELNELRTEHDIIVKKIKELKDDTAAIEKIARDKYDMHLDNEEVFIIED
ncbi:MAG: septum formation initiator family protein [Bacteroidaceae bacterium]|nr:septum formation initiator family protein [Bacteroidaceae bacterium]